jgi:hypothetical protein
MTTTEGPPSEYVGVMEVAAALKKRYHVARDLMLTGKIGEAKYEQRHLVVPRKALAAYIAAHAKEKH